VSPVISRALHIRLHHQSKLGRVVTIEDVATATGITRSALSRLERNQTARVSFATLEKLCRYYGVGVGDLLVLEDDPDPRGGENDSARRTGP
jgi:DNA-binding Xre family transcriptional regulator